MPSTCTVTGTVINPDGTPLVDGSVSATVISHSFTGGALVGGTAFTSTNYDGTFALSLVIGSRVILTIEHVGYSKAFTVPDDPTVDIEDL